MAEVLMPHDVHSDSLAICRITHRLKLTLVPTQIDELMMTPRGGSVTRDKRQEFTLNDGNYRIIEMLG